MELEELIYKYALDNAIKHNGKAAVGPVVSKVMGERPELKKNPKEVVAKVKEIVDKVNSMTLEEQKKEAENKFPEILEKKEKAEEKEKTLPPLPNVKGKVITRFAPNPDGPIHLGNARAAILSYEYAKMYNGDFILRFDDTDPKVKKPIKEAYDWIKEDLKWLGINWKIEFAASSRFERYYEIAKELIEKGFAYVDTCNEEDFKKMKITRNFNLECIKNRSKPPEDNLHLWEKMLNREFKEGEAVLRIKTDLNDPDPSKIDWVMARIIDTTKNPHPLTGDKYWVFPTYNFATVIDDHDFNITHILRAKEHMANADKQKWLFNYLNWEMPEVLEFGRLKLEGFMMSKSKIKGMLEKGTTKDDPRLPTISGLRRRGILPETIREIIIDVGVKDSDATISFENIAALNRKKLDPIAKRIMFVDNYSEFTLNIPEEMTAKIPLYPSGKEYREIRVKPNDKILINNQDAEDGSIIRLLELCNVKVDRKKNMLVYISKDIESAKKLNAKIVQWIREEEGVKTSVIKTCNNQDIKCIEGIAESYIKSLHVGEIVQFIRYGFVRVDDVSNENIKVVYSHE
ncbi:glutamate--tRNA ligase [Acidianus sulfidivorans JP7]|uniref:Glutamate--tRNA ligase n=1 Tax=Acidianus sulfidivorans JP7 TaxID=619593 RepID=A0A2U9IM62_9CREN|nr:glutamate--tRNA ligase [Acidianus sulfidivorans]AWR97107.1 glutamate--tRNA ligase [Acidianus sulfidivorans JP7]